MSRMVSNKRRVRSAFFLTCRLLSSVPFARLRAYRWSPPTPLEPSSAAPRPFPNLRWKTCTKVGPSPIESKMDFKHLSGGDLFRRRVMISFRLQMY